jgi:predicted DNA-binding protein (MmcQ/YjbR family)
MEKDLLARVRRLCLAKPDTEESARLGGEPHFYVGGKIFAGCGVEDGVWCVGMKVGLELQSVLITRPGFRVAKYVGKHGWITVEERALQDDAELAELLQRSYELIAAGKAKKKVAKKATVAKVARKPVRKAKRAK